MRHGLGLYRASPRWAACATKGTYWGRRAVVCASHSSIGVDDDADGTESGDAMRVLGSIFLRLKNRFSAVVIPTMVAEILAGERDEQVILEEKSRRRRGPGSKSARPRTARKHRYTMMITGSRGFCTFVG